MVRLAGKVPVNPPLLVRFSLAAQVLALRLAALLCHARRDEGGNGVLRLERSAKGARLALDGDWAVNHPRTMHLLGEEVALWAQSGRMTLKVETA